MRNLCMVVGALILIGTAGASDLNTITLRQIILQIGISFLFIVVGVVAKMHLPARACLRGKRKRMDRRNLQNAA